MRLLFRFSCAPISILFGDAAYAIFIYGQHRLQSARQYLLYVEYTIYMYVCVGIFYCIGCASIETIEQLICMHKICNWDLRLNDLWVRVLHFMRFQATPTKFNNWQIVRQTNDIGLKKRAGKANLPQNTFWQVEEISYRFLCPNLNGNSIDFAQICKKCAQVTLPDLITRSTFWQPVNFVRWTAFFSCTSGTHHAYALWLPLHLQFTFSWHKAQGVNYSLAQRLVGTIWSTKNAIQIN